jgi:hypothetical protein
VLVNTGHLVQNLTMTELAQAIQFLEAFPEAAAWKVVILDRDKQRKFLGPEMSCKEVRKHLGAWVQQRNAHVFVRPLIANLVFLDLDKFPIGQEHFGALVRLQPRAIVRTSNGNYQAWFTVPKACSAGDALLVSKALTECFHADFGSVNYMVSHRSFVCSNICPSKPICAN